MVCGSRGVGVCTCWFVEEVGQQAAHHGLMADDQNIFLPLQLHDNWLQTMDKVLIGLDGGQKDRRVHQLFKQTN